jgi:outer membrane protein assembly factor BamB
LTAGRRSLFISDAGSDVWQLDLRNGGDQWKQDALHQRRLTVPALIRNRLVIGDFEGYLHALSADDGSLVGRLQIDDEPVRATPVVYDETLYVYTSGGVLAAIGID